MSTLTIGRQMQQMQISESFEEISPPRIELPKRPGRGTMGTPVNLDVNYFAMTLSKLEVYRYSIEIKARTNPLPRPSVPTSNASAVPRIPVGKKIVQIVKLWLARRELDQYRDGLFTDFKAQLYSTKTLPTNIHGLVVHYRAEHNNQADQNAPQYPVHLKYTGKVKFADLIQAAQGGDPGLFHKTKQELIQTLNIALLNYARSSNNCLSVGSRRSFPSENRVKANTEEMLGGGLGALRGHFSSVRAFDTDIYANVNVSHGAFYNSGRLDELMTTFQGQGQLDRRSLNSFLGGLRVGRNHLGVPAASRAKTIVGLATKSDGLATDNHRPIVPYSGAGPAAVAFWWAPQSREAGYITVENYFKMRYPQVTMNTEKPVVNVGSSKRPEYLPAEVCQVAFGQPYTKKLSPTQTDEMGNFARCKPPDAKDSITTDGPVNVGLTRANSLLSRLNISCQTEMAKVNGRLLDSPTIQYALSTTVKPSDGKWNMLNKKVRVGARLPGWSYLKIDINGKESPNDLSKVRNAVNGFRIKAAGTGLVMPGPTSSGELGISGPHDKKLRDWIDARRDKKMPFRFILVILPWKDTQLYNAVKRIGDVEVGIHTVCVLSEKFCMEKNDQYWANVALKFNLKATGTNHGIDKGALGIIEDNKTMVVGIDVTHPSPGSESNCPSVAAMVANIDGNCAQWPATLRLQTKVDDSGRPDPNKKLDPGQEMVSGIVAMIGTRLTLWQHHHKDKFPENILIYRDGVSEGQYQAVLQLELGPIERVCKYQYEKVGQPPPRITLIVVAKRHHTRFFRKSDKDPNKTENPLPGTVVDNTVTDGRTWDFYLQSHKPLQGTARPAHYVVLKNEVFVNTPNVPLRPAGSRNLADVVENITHNMCWLWGRSTTSVSYCPPAYYADRACERARCYLSRYFDRDSAAETSATNPQPNDLQIHEPLQNTMFYI